MLYDERFIIELLQAIAVDMTENLTSPEYAVRMLNDNLKLTRLKASESDLLGVCINIRSIKDSKR